MKFKAKMAFGKHAKRYLAAVVFIGIVVLAFQFLDDSPNGGMGMPQDGGATKASRNGDARSEGLASWMRDLTGRRRSATVKAEIQARERGRALARDYLAGKISPEDAAVALLAEESDNLAFPAWEAFFGIIRAEDLPMFFRELRSNGASSVKAQFLPRLVARANIGIKDAKLAEKLIDQLPEGSLRMLCIQALFRGDPQMVLEHGQFLSSLSGNDASLGLRAFYGQMLDKLDTPILKEFFGSLSESTAKGIARAALSVRIGKDAQSLADVAKGLQDIDGVSMYNKEDALFAFLKEQKLSSESYAALSLNQVPVELRAEFAEAVSGMIARNSGPVEAMSWLLEQAHQDPAVQKNPDLARRAVTGAMFRLMDSDPERAEEFVSGQSSGKPKDYMIQAMLQKLPQDDQTEKRLRWIKEFSDPKLIDGAMFDERVREKERKARVSAGGTSGDGR